MSSLTDFQYQLIKITWWIPIFIDRLLRVKRAKKKKVHQKNLRWSLPPRNLKVVTGSSIEAGTWWLIATYRYFASASRLICILFAGFPSIVYSPSICHSRLLKVEQTPSQEPCVTLRNNIEYKGSYPLNKKIIRK